MAGNTSTFQCYAYMRETVPRREQSHICTVWGSRESLFFIIMGKRREIISYSHTLPLDSIQRK